MISLARNPSVRITPNAQQRVQHISHGRLHQERARARAHTRAFKVEISVTVTSIPDHYRRRPRRERERERLSARFAQVAERATRINRARKSRHEFTGRTRLSNRSRNDVCSIDTAAPSTCLYIFPLISKISRCFAETSRRNISPRLVTARSTYFRWRRFALARVYSLCIFRADIFSRCLGRAQGRRRKDPSFLL